MEVPKNIAKLITACRVCEGHGKKGDVQEDGKIEWIICKECNGVGATGDIEKISPR